MKTLLHRMTQFQHSGDHAINQQVQCLKLQVRVQSEYHPGNTAQRSNPAVAGMMRYNTRQMCLKVTMAQTG